MLIKSEQLSVGSLIKNVMLKYLFWASYILRLCAQTCTPNRHIVIPDPQKVYRCHALLCWTSEVLSKTKISLKVGNITDLPRWHGPSSTFVQGQSVFPLLLPIPQPRIKWGIVNSTLKAKACHDWLTSTYFTSFWFVSV